MMTPLQKWHTRRDYLLRLEQALDTRLLVELGVLDTEDQILLEKARELQDHIRHRYPGVFDPKNP